MRGFRFWDKLEKKMIYSENSGSKEYPVLLAIGLHGLPIAIDNDSFKDNEIIGWNRDHNLIRMDSTGLKDKNGKEIYEGDIVLIDKENNIKGIVKYSEVFAQFIIVNTNSIADEAEPLGDYEDLEILGNEYKNPELLEE